MCITIYQKKPMIVFLINNHYQRLMNDFSLIFPNNNRNAGGIQFYNHIHFMRNTLTKDEFMLHHTFYCAVSGSPIDPSRETIYNHIVVNHIDGRQFVGKYYRCCWPCLCDYEICFSITSYCRYSGYDHEHMVLTINDLSKGRRHTFRNNRISTVKINKQKMVYEQIQID